MENNNTKMFLVFGILALLIGVVGMNVYNTQSSQVMSIEKNYAGLYALRLIPNSVELPATKTDIVIAVSNDGSKEMVDSPFGYVYERNR